MNKMQKFKRVTVWGEERWNSIMYNLLKKSEAAQKNIATGIKRDKDAKVFIKKVANANDLYDEMTKISTDAESDGIKAPSWYKAAIRELSTWIKKGVMYHGKLKGGMQKFRPAKVTMVAAKAKAQRQLKRVERAISDLKADKSGSLKRAKKVYEFLFYKWLIAYTKYYDSDLLRDVDWYEKLHTRGNYLITLYDEKSKNVQKYMKKPNPNVDHVKRMLQGAIKQLNKAAGTITDVIDGKQNPTLAMVNRLNGQLKVAKKLFSKYKGKTGGSDEYRKLDHDIMFTEIAIKALRKMLDVIEGEKGMGKGVSKGAVSAGISLGRRLFKPAARVAQSVSRAMGRKGLKGGIKRADKLVARRVVKPGIKGLKAGKLAVRRGYRKVVPLKARRPIHAVASLGGSIAAVTQYENIKDKAKRGMGFKSLQSELNNIRKMAQRAVKGE